MTKYVMRNDINEAASMVEPALPTDSVDVNEGSVSRRSTLLSELMRLI